jgi:hypothetical protein
MNVALSSEPITAGGMTPKEALEAILKSNVHSAIGDLSRAQRACMRLALVELRDNRQYIDDEHRDVHKRVNLMLQKLACGNQEQASALLSVIHDASALLGLSSAPENEKLLIDNIVTRALTNAQLEGIEPSSLERIKLLLFKFVQEYHEHGSRNTEVTRKLHAMENEQGFSKQIIQAIIASMITNTRDYFEPSRLR